MNKLWVLLTQIMVLIMIGVGLTACTQDYDYNYAYDDVSTPQDKGNALICAAAGAGTAVLFSSSYLVAAVLVPAGAAIGYYYPRFKDGGAIQKAGGEIFQIGDYVTIVLPADQVFDAGTADIKPSARNILDESARVIAEFPDSKVLVTAHTDNIGTELYQAKLSRKQANAVALNIWQDDHINHKTFDRFQFAGMGDSKPVSNNRSYEGQMLNRRVQITIYPASMSQEFKQALTGVDVSAI